jgi:hypothetical protein
LTVPIAHGAHGLLMPLLKIEYELRRERSEVSGSVFER